MNLLTALLIAFTLVPQHELPQKGGERYNRTESVAQVFEQGRSVAAFDKQLAEYYSLAIIHPNIGVMKITLGPMLHRANASQQNKAPQNNCSYLAEATQDFQNYFCRSDKAEHQIAQVIPQMQHPEKLF